MMSAVDHAEGAIDLENWMAKLPPIIKQESLIYLAIPGSHNSMTYSITSNSEIAPDAPVSIKQLVKLFKSTVIGWTKTQEIDATQQLMQGVRYFDLRVATKDGTDSLFFTHGLYADEVTGPLEQIQLFIEHHPLEVVILDFQHFYGFTIEDHRNLVNIVMTLFADKLISPTHQLESITLSSLQHTGKQVVIVYRQSLILTTMFWQSSMLPTPWPRQDTTAGLSNYLLHLRRPKDVGFVHQAVVTPTSSFILLRLWSTIKDSCAAPVLKYVLPDIMSLSPGPPSKDHNDIPTVNVVIGDYIDLNDSEFTRAIVSLNYKLLNGRPCHNNCSPN